MKESDTLSTALHSLRERMQQRYEEQQTPWEHELPPPEILALPQRLRPGRALDLGCGSGRAAIYLAQHGWRTTGVDFVEQAIEQAHARAERAGVAARTDWHVASVTALDMLGSDVYDLAIDVGCMHSFEKADIQHTLAGVARLLRAGGMLVWFVHLRDEDAPPEEHQRFRLTPADVRQLTAAAFVIERVEQGTTTTPHGTWPSAWFWMVRRRQG